MRVLDLFSGVGGFSLGLEAAGMRTVQFVECDEFCQHVLRLHWPAVPVHGDIRTFHAPVGFADVICGGFPCQDISYAGEGLGLAGERSGLWREYARLVGEVRPRFVIVENAAALLSRGLGEVLGDLAALGFDAEWHCIPASAIGAPHRRDRLWLVAYPRGFDVERWGADGILAGATRAIEADRTQWKRRRNAARDRRPALADTRSARLQGAGNVASATRDATTGQPLLGDAYHGWQWSVEPDVGRVADGVPARVDRLRSLGNAVVPQIPEIIGRAIVRAANVTSEGHGNG